VPRRNVELRVGVLVILAIVTLSTWLLFLKEFKFRTATFPVTVDFAQAGGLKRGAEVLARGVVRGKVREVRLMQDRVRVVLEVEEGTFLGEDARFELKADPINPTGVRIFPGSSVEALDIQGIHLGSTGVDMNALVRQGAGLVKSMDALAARLDSLSSGGRLERLAGDIEGGVAELRGWAEESRVGTRDLLTRLDRLTVDLNEFVGEIREPAGEAVAALGHAAARTDSLTADLGDLTESLSRLTEGLEQGEGSLGKLIASPALHDSIAVTVERLDSLIGEIMENPKKYISFELF
jgi:phospholipid/cholesterol/gamma-HCH transport system substrate-binding protein